MTTFPASGEVSLSRREWLRRTTVGVGLIGLNGLGGSLLAQQPKKSGKVETPPPTRPPLQPVDLGQHPRGVERLDLFLLLGQSNMKGRGVMPEEPKRDPRVVMMHLKDDSWYLARHPLHLTGDAKTFKGADNAGVGPGLAFAEMIAARGAAIRVGLVPCAVGGSQIALWQKGARLYDEALRRGQLAVRQASPVSGRIRAALWLQGEADATDERLPVYEAKLLKMIDDLRTDLALPQLPFIACTIGEMRPDEGARRNADMNRLLLSLPEKRSGTACVDARDLTDSIGDQVHFDTASQNEIGRRFAAKYFALTQQM